MDRLTLVPLVRRGTKDGAKAPRRFYDFVVNGRSLFELLGVAQLDRMSVLSRELPNGAACDRLLLRTNDAPLAVGQVALYICPECADYGCGVTLVAVARRGDRVVWSEFADHDGVDDAPSLIAGVGPFEFDQVEYEAAIDAAR